jgi:polysaccharide export outer membrane protein
MRLRRLLVMLLAALTLSACARSLPRTFAEPAYVSEPTAISELDAMMYGAPRAPSPTVARVREVVPVREDFEGGPYTLDSGDKLRIVVFGQDTLSNNYIVDAQGQVALPLIGAVKARGLTTTQLAGSIKARLAAGFIREPSVAVEIETHRPFFVLGEVTYPGQYPYVPHMTVENAIAIAGGFTPRGYKWDVTVTRKLDGVPVRLTLPLGDPLCPGDTITVTERWF